jgi:hypothetical protein
MSTVFADWLESGESDPFNGHYDGGIDKLALGHMPTKVLMALLEPMAGSLGGIVYLAAGKERLRWLSKRLFDKSNDHDGVNQRRAALPNGELSDYRLANHFFLTESADDIQAAVARIKFLSDELSALGDDNI